MKKILIFSTAYFPFIGGAEMAVKEITDRLDGIECSMITARMDGKLAKFERIGNVNIHRVGFGWGVLDKYILAFFGSRIARKLDKEADFGSIWSIMASQAGIAASFYKKSNPEKRFILTLQEGDEEDHLRRYVFGNSFLYGLMIRPWHLLPFKNADVVTVISTYLKKRALANGVAGEKIKIIPNAVDPERFARDYAAEDLLCLKRELNKKENDKFIITTSRLVKKNAVGDIVSSLRHLPENIKLIVLGDGYEKKDLQELSASEGVEDRVKFLGLVSQKELPKYLKISDVFVRPSLSEGFGNSFIEAMAAGLPVIATPVGGIVDFLRNNETGWFCEVNNPKSIASKILHIVNEDNKKEIERVVANAKAMACEQYNWNEVAEKTAKLFNKA